MRNHLRLLNNETKSSEYRVFGGGKLPFEAVEQAKFYAVDPELLHLLGATPSDLWRPSQFNEAIREI